MNKYIKSLIENSFTSIFDDDIFSISDNPYDDIDDYNISTTLSIAKETLCIPNDYKSVRPEDKSGITLIKRLDDEDGAKVYLACPITNYTFSKLGPRKRKKYPIEYFYKYKLRIAADGIDLEVYRSSDDKIVLSEDITEFIERSPYEFKSIKYFNFGSTVNEQYAYKLFPVKQDYILKIFIFLKNQNRYNRHFTDKFVYNFPNVIEPKFNDELYNTNNPSSKFVTEIYKTWFTSNKLFITFIKKLINNNFIIVDDEKYLYNKDNIDLMTHKLLSGEHEEELAAKQSAKTEFITNILGQDYIDKFNKLIDYYKTTERLNHVYLKTFNTLRKTKVCMAETFYQLRKDNNLLSKDPTYDDLSTFRSNGEYLYKCILYKMFENLYFLGLNSYNQREKYNLRDIIEGVDSMYGTKYINVNDLPIYLDHYEDLFILYYIIGITLKQSKDMESILPDEDNRTYNYSNELCNKIQNYNSQINTIDGFNFTYLTNLIKTLIDDKIKKYKIK